jgi:predicted nucleic acid-binding protein
VRYVVDASVAVEVLLRTELGRSVMPLLREADLLAPELIDVEVLAALRRAVLGGRLDHDRAAEALDDLVLWPIERVSHAPLLAVAWSHRHNASGYDATYLAAARVHRAALLTAVTGLAGMPNPGVPVHLVRA